MIIDIAVHTSSIECPASPPPPTPVDAPQHISATRVWLRGRTMHGDLLAGCLDATRHLHHLHHNAMRHADRRSPSAAGPNHSSESVSTEAPNV